MINDALKEMDPEQDNFLSIIRTHGLVKRGSMVLAEKFDAMQVETNKETMQTTLERRGSKTLPNNHANKLSDAILGGLPPIVKEKYEKFGPFDYDSYKPDNTTPFEKRDPVHANNGDVY